METATTTVTRKPKPLYERLAELIMQHQNCIKHGNSRYEEISYETIQFLVKEFMASGSGFDAGTTLDLDRSNGERLVFHTSFHHMDEHGGYDGWTSHVVTVRGSLWNKFRLTISGRDRNGIKDVIHDRFDTPLREMVTD